LDDLPFELHGLIICRDAIADNTISDQGAEGGWQRSDDFKPAFAARVPDKVALSKRKDHVE
jgi:hypothetical protein